MIDAAWRPSEVRCPFRQRQRHGRARGDVIAWPTGIGSQPARQRGGWATVWGQAMRVVRGNAVISDHLHQMSIS